MEVGDNKPDELAALRDALRRDHAPIMRRRDELLAAVARMPDAVDDDDTAGKFGDMAKLMQACGKNAEAERIATKEPHLAAGRAIDGFFKAITDPLDKALSGIRAKVTVFERRKADAGRKRREEEARAAAAAARKAAEEASAKEAKIENADDLDRAIDAHAAAAQADKDRVAAARAAAAKAAELSQTRGEMSQSSLRTFWTFDQASLNRKTLDLEALRQHLPTECLEKAVRSFITAEGRELRGVRIFEDTQAVIR